MSEGLVHVLKGQTLVEITAKMTKTPKTTNT